MRGSIPFYWENTNLKSLKPGFTYFFNLNEGFESTIKHFQNLQSWYQGEICVLNLIKKKKGKANESLIGTEFWKFCRFPEDHNCPDIDY